MRIVALEEHIADRELSRAVGPISAKLAPYAAGLGSLVEERPLEELQDRPRLQGPARAEQLVAAPVETRLEAMDENGIDMQVLSSTRPTQMLPAAQAIDLAMRANDGLSAIVAQHPRRFDTRSLNRRPFLAQCSLSPTRAPQLFGHRGAAVHLPEQL